MAPRDTFMHARRVWKTSPNNASFAHTAKCNALINRVEKELLYRQRAFRPLLPPKRLLQHNSFSQRKTLNPTAASFGFHTGLGCTLLPPLFATIPTAHAADATVAPPATDDAVTRPGGDARTMRVCQKRARRGFLQASATSRVRAYATPRHRQRSKGERRITRAQAGTCE